MPDESATRETRRPNTRKFSRAIVPLAIFAFIGIYVFGNIPGEIARWKMAAARSQFAHDQGEQAIETAASAQAWDSDNLGIGLQRVRWFQDQPDFEGALTLLNELLAEYQGKQGIEFSLLQIRSDVLQNLGRHKQAIADADRVVESAKQSGNEGAIINAYNMRAYTVAHAASVGQATPRQIGNALLEMRDVMRRCYGDRQMLLSIDPSLEQTFAYQIQETKYLDTYAYLHLFAGKQHHQTALRDLNRCVESCDQIISLARDYGEDISNYLVMDELVADIKKHKATIIHHRGEVYFAMGNKSAARADIQTAQQLGYDRAKGDW